MLWRSGSGDNSVDVICPHMQGMQMPASMVTDLFYGLTYHLAATGIELYRGVLQAPRANGGLSWVAGQQWCCGHVMPMATHGSPFVSWDPRAVAPER